MRATKYTALCLFAILSLAFLLHGTLPSGKYRIMDTGQ